MRKSLVVMLMGLLFMAIGSQAGKAEELAIPLIKKCEGFRSTMYWDCGHWAIGYGTQIDPKKYRGKKISQITATRLLLSHIAQISYRLGSRSIYLTPQKKAALISFVYNFGLTKYNRSTLSKHVRLGKHKLVPNELRKWRYAYVNRKWKALPGLVKRRNAEIQLWNTAKC